MLKRLLSAIILAPIFLALIYVGKIPFALLCMAMSLLSVWEFRNIVKGMEMDFMSSFSLVGAILIPLLLYYDPTWLGFFFFLYAATGFLVSLNEFPLAGLGDFGANIVGTIYIGFGYGFFILLRQMDQGFILCIYAMLIIWMTDIFGYFVGCGIGKTPFFQYISPHKTVEGAIAGTLGGTLSGILFVLLMNRFQPVNNLGLLCILAPFLSLVGQAGDLYESSLKRQAGIKDSGNLIPGHGGILDRMDSTLFVIPLLYNVLKLIETIF